MAIEFRPFQIQDLARKIADPKLAFFHDAGTGKTPIAAAYTRYCVQNKDAHVVWTCPSGIMLKNKMDMVKFGGIDPASIHILQGHSPAKREELMRDPKGRVYLMSAQGFAGEWEKLNKIKGGNLRDLIHDESHLYYAGHNAKRTQEWYRAARKMESVTPMTGSVLKGRLDSMYPILHALHPQYYGNYENFMREHAMYDGYGGVMGWRGQERLKAIMGVIGIRRSFKEVYGAENKVILPEPLRLGKAHSKLYNEFKSKGFIELPDRFLKAPSGGVQAIYERQMLAHPETFGLKETTARDEWLSDMIDTALFENSRLAIFSSLIPEMERTVALIKAKGGKVALINGDISGAERQRIDQRFQTGEIQFIVASPATAGVGFNWHFLSDMIFLSTDYSDDSFMQAYRRGIRGVRDTPLRIHLPYYADSVEETVISKIEWKSQEANKVDSTIEVIEIQKEKVVLPVAANGKLSMGNF